MDGPSTSGRACPTILAGIPFPPMKSTWKARTSWSAGSSSPANSFSIQREAFCMSFRAEQGLDLLMNGDSEAAIKAFGKIQSNDPDSALGYLMEANALWWEIYLTTGNLIDPDVFVVSSGSSSPYDARFNKLVDTAIARARANRNAKRDVARNYLYEGMAYALRGRLASLRQSNLAAARAGKQMRSLLISALHEDRNLRDAYAGLGLYDYFVDTLPTIVKLLRWMIGLPGGSRERGLHEIEYAAKYGELTRGEAP